MADLEDPREPSNEELQLLMMMRLYDVNMTILRAMSPDVAEALAKVHEEGRLVFDEIRYSE